MKLYDKCIVLLLLAVLSCWRTEADLQARPQKARTQSHSLSSSSGSSLSNNRGSNIGSSSIGNANSNGDNRRSSLMQSSEVNAKDSQSNSMLNFALDIKDEIVDIFDGFVLADSHEERLDHFLDTLDRHKKTIGFVGGAWFIKNRLIAGTVASAKAGQTMTSMRGAQIAKWGTRKAAGM